MFNNEKAGLEQGQITNWMQTFSGYKLNFANPNTSQISIIDIAQGLSNVVRYSGQTSFPYTVAQHSVMMSYRCPGYELEALLHDAPEAYMSDLPNPLKNLCPGFKEVENRLWEVIADKFSLDYELPKEVKNADIRMLNTERRALFKDQLDWGAVEEFEPYTDLIIMPFEKPYEIFLQRFEELFNEKHGVK